MVWDEGERVNVAAARNGKKWYRLYCAWASVAGAKVDPGARQKPSSVGTSFRRRNRDRMYIVQGLSPFYDPRAFPLYHLASRKYGYKYCHGFISAVAAAAHHRIWRPHE
jgi:hypothetical protein